jgi:hypothetical protein
MTTTAEHDAYIAAAPEPFQPSLERARPPPDDVQPEPGRISPDS